MSVALPVPDAGKGLPHEVGGKTRPVRSRFPLTVRPKYSPQTILRVFTGLKAHYHWGLPGDSPAQLSKLEYKRHNLQNWCEQPAKAPGTTVISGLLCHRGFNGTAHDGRRKNKDIKTLGQSDSEERDPEWTGFCEGLTRVSR